MPKISDGTQRTLFRRSACHLHSIRLQMYYRLRAYRILPCGIFVLSSLFFAIKAFVCAIKGFDSPIKSADSPIKAFDWKTNPLERKLFSAQLTEYNGVKVVKGDRECPVYTHNGRFLLFTNVEKPRFHRFLRR